MPTYDYRCPACGHVQEEMHSMSADPEIKCDECSSVMTRVISGGSGVIFRGSGFYQTDYKLASSLSVNEERPYSVTKDSGVYVPPEE